MRQVWIRANGTVPDDIRVHQYLLGYASDLNFLPVALQPHGIGFSGKGIQIATIDPLCGSIVRSILMNGYFIAWSTSASSAPGAFCSRRVLYSGWRVGRFNRAGRGNA